MKNFFKRIKSYSFWVSLSAALIMLLTSLGKAFGFEVQNDVVEDCVMSIAGFLAVFGIVSMSDKRPNINDEIDELEDENDDSKDSDENNDEEE